MFHTAHLRRLQPEIRHAMLDHGHVAADTVFVTHQPVIAASIHR
jgi:hypothetical protein